MEELASPSRMRWAISSVNDPSEECGGLPHCVGVVVLVTRSYNRNVLRLVWFNFSVDRARRVQMQGGS